MKYSDIVGVDSFFDSTFNITEEKDNYWKQFVTNEKFESNLHKILSAFNSENTNNRKSIWVQGTYGTGKSHSTSVVKHLLSDDLSEIEAYVSKLSSVQLKKELIEFRKNKSIFPVVLKGANGIVDVEEMKYVIQKAVVSQLKSKGYELIIKSDFEAMIAMVKDARFESYWKAELEGNLGNYVQSTSEIVSRLEAGDPELLKEINKSLKAANMMRATEDIVTWLKEAKSELKAKGIADYLVIFWDEFTSLLEIVERRSILNTIQDIAELSKAPDPDDKNQLIGVYTFLVTHKNLESLDSYKELKEDERTMAKSRFLELKYDMEPITTYHILSNAISVKNNEIDNRLITERITNNISISNTLDRITANANRPEIIKNNIKRLYPIHPYTAYLATFVSRAIGSAERSIFEFLNDDTKGFKKFIDYDIDKKYFLTADMVWDFFSEAFAEDNSGKFDAITNKFTMYNDTVEKKGKLYSAVFKTVLLLNLLNRVTAIDTAFSESDLVSPSENNIKDALTGQYSLSDITEVLSYLSNSSIIIRNPEGIYEISSSTMPLDKIKSEKENLYKRYEDVSNILEDYPATFLKLKTEITRSIYRKNTIIPLWGGLSKTSFHSRLNKLVNDVKGYEFKIALVFFRGDTSTYNSLKQNQRDEAPIGSQKNIISELSNKEEYRNITFIVVDTALGNQKFEQIVENLAISKVAENLRNSEEANKANTNATKWVESWVNEIIGSGKCTVLFRGSSIDTTYKAVGQILKEKIMTIIFDRCLDTYSFARDASTAWKPKNSKQVVQNICFANSREEFESKTVGSASILKSLIKSRDGSYIFDEKMRYTSHGSLDNPLDKLVIEVDKSIGNIKGKATADLGEEFSFLSEPGYGFYKSDICMGMLALVFRRYIGEFYSADTGEAINQMQMKDIIVAMFDYWEKGTSNSKLRIRFSSEEEKEFIQEFKDIFDVSGSGIQETKWNVRNSYKSKNKAPLWTLKYVESQKSDEYKSLIDQLFDITTKTTTTIDSKLIESILPKLKRYRTDIKLSLRKITNDDAIIAYVKYVLSKYHRNTDEVDSILEYLNKEMAENIVYWEESLVSEKITSWLINQTNPSKAVSDDEFIDDIDNVYDEDDSMDDDDFNQDEDRPSFDTLVLTPIVFEGHTNTILAKAKDLVKANTKSEDRYKDILLELCQQYPVICDKVIEMFEEE